MQNKRFIITGGPGAGKTTLLQKLRKKGILCYDEISREVIKEQQKIGGKATPWEDVEDFAKITFSEIEKQLKKTPNELSFFDRGLADVIAYLSIEGKEIPKYILNYPYHDFYNSKVFILKPKKEYYKQDSQRLQSFEKSMAIYNKLYVVYSSLGFDLVLL
ncbi:AAA family ATPase [Aureivirga sp. CE67]|uniref:AAA family ATPase n=1 Tax=Aureivirga sp. CE67 TaxID=1788983 RepID=UPI0018CB5736|nr:AAA family ATPase [Aureivirga sp. CE67]